MAMDRHGKNLFFYRFIANRQGSSLRPCLCIAGWGGLSILGLTLTGRQQILGTAATLASVSQQTRLSSRALCHTNNAGWSGIISLESPASDDDDLWRERLSIRTRVGLLPGVDCVSRPRPLNIAVALLVRCDACRCVLTLTASAPI